MTKFPSTDVLRAFDAVARHQSFTRAAGELGVTHGAISHRIRNLEAMAGVVLFERSGQCMIPTLAAQRYLHTVRQSLTLIAGLFPDPKSMKELKLTISVLPSFASHWLMMRLDAFHEENPDIQIVLDARLELAKVGAGGVDAAIRHGTGQWTGCKAERLMSETIFPVCSPLYREKMQIEGPDDLKRCKLLRHSFQPWKLWFEAAGLTCHEPVNSAAYDDAGLLLDAAIAGNGVVLTRSILAADALAAGRIVRLFNVDLPFFGSYYYVRSKRLSPNESAIDLFGKWLAKTLRSELSGR